MQSQNFWIWHFNKYCKHLHSLVIYQLHKTQWKQQVWDQCPNCITSSPGSISWGIRSDVHKESSRQDTFVSKKKSLNEWRWRLWCRTDNMINPVVINTYIIIWTFCGCGAVRWKKKTPCMYIGTKSDIIFQHILKRQEFSRNAFFFLKILAFSKKSFII